MNRFIHRGLMSGVLVAAMVGCASPPEPPAAVDHRAPQTAEGVVRELYRLVSVEPGGPLPDWDVVRSLFLDDAVIVLRNTRESTAVFSVDGFIDDFRTFNERARIRERGFTERIVRLKPMVFRDLAHVFVLYEAAISTSSRPPQQGLDSFQVIRKDGRWWIASVVNEIPEADQPIPADIWD